MWTTMDSLENKKHTAKWKTLSFEEFAFET